MNSKAYLEGLDSLKEDFEPGLLSELRMDVPDRLHASVMSEIKAQKKKRFYANFRVYMPVAAAVLVAAMFINGGRNYIDQLYPEKPVKSAIVTPQTGLTITPTVPADPINTNQPTVSKSPTGVQGKATNIASDNKIIGKTNDKVSSEIKKPSATEQNNNATKNPEVNSGTTGTDISGKEIVASTGNDSGSQSAVTDSNINLEVTATSQSDVINFLKSYAALADDGKNKIYKLNISYFSQLKSILESGTAESKVINGNIAGDNFVIKLVIEE